MKNFNPTDLTKSPVPRYLVRFAALLCAGGCCLVLGTWGCGNPTQPAGADGESADEDGRCRDGQSLTGIWFVFFENDPDCVATVTVGGMDPPAGSGFESQDEGLCAEQPFSASNPPGQGTEIENSEGTLLSQIVPPGTNPAIESIIAYSTAFPVCQEGTRLNISKLDEWAFLLLFQLKNSAGSRVFDELLLSGAVEEMGRPGLIDDVVQFEFTAQNWTGSVKMTLSGTGLITDPGTQGPCWDLAILEGDMEFRYTVSFSDGITIYPWYEAIRIGRFWAMMELYDCDGGSIFTTVPSGSE